MGGLGERAAGLQVAGVGRVVPVGEVGDEVEEGEADVFEVIEVGGVLAGMLDTRQALRAGEVAVMVGPGLHLVAGEGAEGRRAERVGGVGPERGADDGATGGEGAARPPDVKGGDVAVADALLAAGMGRDAADGQVYLDQAFGVLGGGSRHRSGYSVSALDTSPT